MADAVQRARFQVSIPGTTGRIDEFGLWEPAPAAARGAAEISRWVVALPADDQPARGALVAQRTRLAHAEVALPAASRRLRTFVRRSRVQGAESFSAQVASDRGARRPEQELAAWVSAAGGEASFGLFDNLPTNWREIAAEATAFFERVRQALLYFAWVESISGDRRIGLTAVAWTGHFQTAWGSGLGAADQDRHIMSLELALRTRAAWLRMALLVARGGVQLGLLFPANPFLAVPAAWRFFKQVIDVSREIEQLPQS